MSKKKKIAGGDPGGDENWREDVLRANRAVARASSDLLRREQQLASAKVEHRAAEGRVEIALENLRDAIEQRRLPLEGASTLGSDADGAVDVLEIDVP